MSLGRLSDANQIRLDQGRSLGSLAHARVHTRAHPRPPAPTRTHILERVRERRTVGQAAHVLVHLDEEVAVHAERLGPAVLHDVVGQAVLGIVLVVPNGEDGVVDVLRLRLADGGGVDAADVVAEVRGDLGGSLGDGYGSGVGVGLGYGSVVIVVDVDVAHMRARARACARAHTHTW